MVKIKLNQAGDDWIKLENYSKDPESFYFDGEAFDALQNIKKVMNRRNVDFPVGVTGYPGVGKSKLTSQVASILDPTFTEDRMHQTTDAFIKGVQEETQPLKCHVLDEAWDGLSSSSVRKEAGKLFVNMLNVIRQKRLYIIIVLPDFFELSKHIAIFRTRWLFHCYGENFGDVGNFAAFGQEAKKMLYIKGKPFLNYNAHPYDIHGKFTDGNPKNFNWDRYENTIKKQSLGTSTQKFENESKAVQQRNICLGILKNRHRWATKDLAELVNMNRKVIQRLVKVEKDKEEDPNTSPSSELIS